jgi:hypothetical protein
MAATHQRADSNTKDSRVVSTRRGGSQQLRASLDSPHGKQGLDLRLYYQGTDGSMLPSPKGLWLHDCEVPLVIAALQDLLPVNEDTPGAAVPTPRRKPGMSQQDRALVLLADGFGPHDLPERLYPNEAPNPRRLIELGKALRRVGLLVPGDWTLTALGQVRAAELRPSMGEASGESPIDGQAQFPLPPVNPQ